MNSIESILMNIICQRYKILKASNEHVKILISKMEGCPGKKIIVTIAKDQGVVIENKEGIKRRTRENTRKMIVGSSLHIS